MTYTPEEIIIKLKKLIKKIEQFQTDMSECEITPAQGRILYPIIKNEKGYTMPELTEIVGVDKALVSRTIADLENKGIVERDNSFDKFKRNYKIILSKKGRELCNETLKRHEKEFAKWHNKFTQEEIINFINVIEKLTTEGE